MNKSESNPTWLKDFLENWDLPATQHAHANWSKAAFLRNAYKRGLTVYEAELEGTTEEASVLEIIKKIKKLSSELKLSFTNFLEDEEGVLPEMNKSTAPSSIFDEGSSMKRCFSSTLWEETSVVSIFVNTDDDSSSISIFGVDKQRVKTLKKEFSPFFSKKSDQIGSVHVLETSMDGIYISKLGKGGSPLMRENYDKSIIDDFDFITKQLTDPEPVGRLFILDGPPGTGKTYFVRGLLEAVTNAVFLLIPSKQIGSLSDPNFFPAIKRLHVQEKAPIILILEDADDALLPRDISNMSTISDLLNFADGIIGNIIDIRILATTNARKIEIDPALRRKRRLGRNVHIGKLSLEKSKEIFTRLTKDRKIIEGFAYPETEQMTLAEVYGLADVALGRMSVSEYTEQNKVGFNSGKG